MQNLFPKSAGVQHIAFFYRAEFFVSLPGGFETDAADTFDFLFTVFQHIDGRISFGFVFTKIDTAGQFPYNNKVNAFLYNTLLQG